MGIKLHCPKGHKLHVKSFLSGKKAICPKCGVHVTIPVVEGASAGQQSTNGNSAVLIDDGSDDLLDAEFAPLEGAYALGAAGQASQTLAQSPSGTRVAADLPPTPPPAPTAAPLDPLDAAAGSVWYVRPASGGQYGPASGEIMRDWIGQGRIGNNCLVWRAGWADWQSAAAVFPQLGARFAAPPKEKSAAALPVGALVKPVAAATVPQIEEPSVAPNSTPPAKTPYAATLRRRRNPNSSVLASLILGAISLILVIVLVIVWQQSSPEPEPTVEKSAPETVAEPAPKSEEDALLE